MEAEKIPPEYSMCDWVNIYRAAAAACTEAADLRERAMREPAPNYIKAFDEADDALIDAHACLRAIIDALEGAYHFEVPIDGYDTLAIEQLAG